MKILERQTVKGCFLLRVYRCGKLVEKYEDHNLIVNGAKLQLARLVAGEGTNRHITQIAFGTSAAVPVSSDTAIANPYTKPVDGHTYPAVGQVTFAWTLAASEANGKDISEFGLLCADGTLFARKTRAEAIAKADDISIDGQWTIVF